MYQRIAHGLLTACFFLCSATFASETNQEPNNAVLQAQALIGAGEGVAALNLLLPKAHQGDAEAAYWLGRLYFYDKAGVPRNDRESEHWFAIAANAGHAGAQYKLGGMYFTGRAGITGQREARNAAKWWIASARQGHAESLNNLGALLSIGQGVAMDTELGLTLQIMAAESGSEAGRANLERKGETPSARALANEFKNNPETLKSRLDSL